MLTLLLSDLDILYILCIATIYNYKYIYIYILVLPTAGSASPSPTISRPLQSKFQWSDLVLRRGKAKLVAHISMKFPYIQKHI